MLLVWSHGSRRNSLLCRFRLGVRAAAEVRQLRLDLRWRLLQAGVIHDHYGFDNTGTKLLLLRRRVGFNEERREEYKGGVLSRELKLCRDYIRSRASRKKRRYALGPTPRASKQQATVRERVD